MGAVKNIKEYANEKKYSLLSKFESVEEFNNHFEQTMLLHKKKFNKAEYVALNKLRKYAFNEENPETVGVAWSKIQTVVAATHQDQLFGVSRSSFERMLRKAKKLNLITVYNQFQANGYRKHNVYVFNRFEELTPKAFEIVEIVSETQTIDVSENEKTDVKITLLLKLPCLKDYLTYSPANKVPKKEESNLIDFEENKTEYQQLKQMVDGLFKEKNITYKIYGAWLSQSNKGIFKPPFALAKQALKILIGEVKERIAGDIEPLYNPAGYYRGILLNLINQWCESEIENDRENWFNAANDAEAIQKALEEDRQRYNEQLAEHQCQLEEFLAPDDNAITDIRHMKATKYYFDKLDSAFQIKDRDRKLRRFARLKAYYELTESIDVIYTMRASM